MWRDRPVAIGSPYVSVIPYHVRIPAWEAKPIDLTSACTVQQALELFAAPFNDRLYRAHSVHRQHFDPNAVQLSTLLSIKAGGCFAGANSIFYGEKLLTTANPVVDRDRELFDRLGLKPLQSSA